METIYGRLATDRSLAACIGGPVSNEVDKLLTADFLEETADNTISGSNA